jgi:hypothetical protein
MTRKRKALFIGVLCVAGRPALAQAPPTILDIQGENTVTYSHDVWDYAKIASDPGVAMALRPLKPFQSWIDITDIVAVNGKPARGVWISRADPQLGLDPSAVHGAAMPRSIADVTRSGMVNQYLEILQPDGTPIGTILATGMNFGAPPPGAPAAVVANNLAITGGTGAFLGARGQAGNAGDTFRLTSISEDPANRRINGGRPKRVIIHLIPMSWPEIIMTANGPAVVHASDFTLVSPANPAKAGEILTLFAAGLGPTRPGVDPGRPFPAGPLQIVNSPVEVDINGDAAEVLYAGGYPGVVDRYQVNFRIPDAAVAGVAILHLTAAWITGPEVKIAIR